MASQVMKNEREISKGDDNTAMKSVPIDGIVEELTNNITPKLLRVSPLPASCCIFRVPLQIRQNHEQAYKPYVISIGPFHRGQGGDQFQLMENVKRWYLQCLLSHAKQTLPGLIEGVADLDERARDCYAEPLGLNKEDFVEMMVLDGCFLIELFRKGPSHVLQDDENDPVYCMSGIRLYLYHDLLLLENQLPWFVLQRLYNLTAVKNTTSEGNASSLADLVLKFFTNYVGDNRILNLSVNPLPEIRHILGLIRTSIIANFKDESTGYNKMPRVPTVTTLSEAGIKFKVGPAGGILNMEFKKGEFTMPQLVIDERTGPLLRNLIAFEQCYPSCPHMITSYAVLMDNLINESKDIEHLSDKKILDNWLSSEDAAKLFNELYNETTVMGSYYGKLCEDVNKHYDKKWKKWMEKLRREHFNSPWAIISLVAAFILLALTVLQTYYTIHPYYYPPE